MSNKLDSSDAKHLRVLLLPPTKKDAEAIQKLFAREGISCEIFPSLAVICEEIPKGAGAIVISEEVLYTDRTQLEGCIRAQPVWSDLPIIVLSRSGIESPALTFILSALGNASVLERPVRMTTLVSIVRSALRARERQYQVRDQLEARERAEKALVESREHLELVVKGANVGIWYCPLPLNELHWDDTVKTHFHLPPSANVTIDDFYERLHPDDRDRVRAKIETSISEECSYDIDYRTVSADGDSTKWIRAIGSVFVDQKGKPVRFSGITIDVTERVRAQEELTASEQRLSLAVHTGKLGIWELDLITNELNCSATCKSNFGRSPSDSFTYEDLWKSIHPDDFDRVQEAVRGSISMQTEYDIEYRTIWPDSSVHWVLARGCPNVTTRGTPDQLVGVTLDITDRKAVEERRFALLEAERAARTEAERAGQMKDEFLATLSHELRTPLNAILGWAQILRMPTIGADDVSQGVAIIERNARAQAQIIEDLLDMSRIISGKVRLDVQSVDLNGVIQASVETVQPAARAKEIRIRTILDTVTPTIMGDPNRLQQVFWNLLSNAVKFTPKHGQVKVVLERVNSHLNVRVIDTGEGIDAAFLPHVFDRFRQANATTTRQHGGLGLGLAIVRQLVELHGGTIHVDSPGIGQGSTFTVTLPLTAVHASPISQKGSRNAAAISEKTVQHHSTQMTGLKVVVVDDEPDARFLLKRLLEDCDVKVHAAESAEQAIKLIQTERPHVLISDIGMPGEDGYSLIRRVRSLPSKAGGNTPAVALTAYARAEDRVNAILAGFQHHLSKPVEPAELVAIVASLAGRTNVK